MKVKEFIKWLEKQDQELEVNVVEYGEYHDWVYGEEGEIGINVISTQAVCFDDPIKQSKTTDYSLTLGVER